MLRQKFHVSRRGIQFELHGERDALFIENQFADGIDSPFVMGLPFFPTPVQCRVFLPQSADGFTQLCFRSYGSLFTH